MPQTQWQLPPSSQIPPWFLEAVKSYSPASNGHYLAQILWHRGIKTRQQLETFLNPDAYQPTSAFAFGQEMKLAIQRLEQAMRAEEKVAIWGDFDADGVTSTSLLWEGLGQFFPRQSRLIYYIPNRFTESHGLNCQGIDKLVQWGVNLIVTCDTGSSNLTEIDYANQLGIDLIITDHHTLPDDRPKVVSIINPRYFADHHPLYHLSGVAVAYKLMEALYESFPDIPQQPLEELLDLVAIGLIADLVQLTGDCRYLAQKGLKKLQHTNRYGLEKLLELCKKTGDRPTDISFGIGPRINAVSRIHGDATFCVELLTSRNKKLGHRLAEETELANTRRKSLQQDVLKQAKKQINHLDLSSTGVIVIENNQWQSGVLGLVAASIAQEYGRPTILLTTATQSHPLEDLNHNQGEIARGSARSVNNIDLYELVLSQANLLDRFGGHPYAAGLSLPSENLPLFREAINQQLRQKLDFNLLQPVVEADLIVTVAELGKQLFQELKLLEPCGMGNPVPKLLIRNCWFENIWHINHSDYQGKKIQYIKTTFNICDDSDPSGFQGIWWEHYQDELIPKQRYDVIVELDFYKPKKEAEYRKNIDDKNKNYLIRLRDLIISQENSIFYQIFSEENLIIDARNPETREIKLEEINSQARIIKQCPRSWHELQLEYRQALVRKKKLVLVYPPPKKLPPEQIWKQLVGIGKYLLRTGKIVAKEQLGDKLGISDRTLDLGLEALTKLGMECHQNNQNLQFVRGRENHLEGAKIVKKFLEAVAEEKFQREYFYQVPLSTLESIISNQ
jgi:single-stranded-DNA-specific exonuclease